MLKALKVGLIFMAFVIGKKSLRWFSIFHGSSAVLSSIKETPAFSLVISATVDRLGVNDCH